MAKLELPRRYYTAERLAEHWECSADDITHLVEIGDLKTVPRLAAKHGKSGIWVIPYSDPAETLGPIPADIPGDYLPLFEPREEGETDGDVWVKAWKRARKDGGADPVITAAEVARYESEYYATDGQAPPRLITNGHSTRLLEHLTAAADRFWKLYDPGDPTTAPTNETVSAWLQERGVSSRVADIMAQILRADGIPPGPRK